MVALLAFSDGESFATGLTDYNYRPATEQELMPRIMLQVMIEGLKATTVMDTAAPYMVCAPAIASSINLDPAAALTTIRLLVRGVLLSGRLYRLPITFLARQGDDLTIDATAFVPDPEWAEGWGSRCLVVHLWAGTRPAPTNHHLGFCVPSILRPTAAPPASLQSSVRHRRVAPSG